MVKTGRFTVELVSADVKVAFMEHTKDGKTYAGVEPEVEYFVHLEVEPGPPIWVKIYTNGKDLNLGHFVKIGTPKEKQIFDEGLMSFDGISSTKEALKFAKAVKIDRPSLLVDLL